MVIYIFLFIQNYSQQKKRVSVKCLKNYVGTYLTDKRLENERFKVSVKCLFYLSWIEYLTYRSDGVTPLKDQDLINAKDSIKFL